MQGFKRKLLKIFKQYKGKNGQRGVILFLSLIIMTIILAISFGLNAIFLGQLEVMKGMGNSVIAFHAANTGIERVLAGDQTNPLPVGGTLPNNASYEVFVAIGGIGDCQALNFCIESIGTYRGARRAIEIRY